MSIRSRTEIHLMFLAGLMVKDTFLFKIILDLIIFYINFHLKECSERGDFCKLSRTVSFIYIFNRLHSFSLYNAIYLLIKKLQLKTCNFLLRYSERWWKMRKLENLFIFRGYRLLWKANYLNFTDIKFRRKPTWGHKLSRMINLIKFCGHKTFTERV